MTSIIRTFWKKLAGSVHPDDAPTFQRNTHSFDLRFPPPAFIGDVESAPVILLMANGGVADNLADAQFPDQSAVDSYVKYINGASDVFPLFLSNYYTSKSIFPLIEAGKLALVNAVAYRSKKITAEPDNKALAEKLPSVLTHRLWLHEEVMPAVKSGRRLVVAHRHALWKINRAEYDRYDNFMFTSNPASPYLPDSVRIEIDKFLIRRWQEKFA